MTQAENSRNTEQPASGPAFPCHPEIIPRTDRHTPGPWKVSMNQIKSNYDTVAQVFTHLVQGRNEVNARLIAAAPELLQELKTIVEGAEQSAFETWLYEEFPSGDVAQVKRSWEESSSFADFLAQYKTAIAVVAKATGERE